MSADPVVNLIRGFRERAEALEAENAALVAERDALAVENAEAREHLPNILAAACSYSARLGIYGTLPLPKWIFELIPGGIDHEARPRDEFDRISAERDALLAALRSLERWDMLTLDAAGHGVATADAPWARALIADALGRAVSEDSRPTT